MGQQASTSCFRTQQHFEASFYLYRRLQWLRVQRFAVAAIVGFHFKAGSDLSVFACTNDMDTGHQS